MRVTFRVVVLACALAGSTAIARADTPLGDPSRLVYVGPGASESSQRQVVRTAAGRVYIAAVDDDGWGGDHADLRMYRATSTGAPAAFAAADTASEPHVAAPLTLSGGDARLDAAGTIHLTYAVTNWSDADVGAYPRWTVTVRYQTFDTRSDTWGRPQDVVRLEGDDDEGVRGRVVSGIALDRAGDPLVTIAASSGVSAWRQSVPGRWTRETVAPGPAVHPSVAFDASGTAHLAWLSSPANAPSIRYAQRSPDGSWSTPEVVAGARVLTNATADQGPSLAYDGAGRPVVLWLDDDDLVQVADREAPGVWAPDVPPSVFAHTPALGMSGDDRFVFLGHDLDVHPAYLSHAPGDDAWSSVSVFPPDVGGFYAYDGSASVRFDPLNDTDCGTLDAAFFAEYSERPGREGKPDLYYASVALPAAAACRPAPEPSPTPTPTPTPTATPSPTPTPTPSPTATPTPAPSTDPALGTMRVESQADGNQDGLAEAFQIEATRSSELKALSAYVAPESEADRLIVGLYTDAGGHPGTLITQANRPATPGQWNTVTVTDAAVRAGGHYWVALLGTGGRLAFRDSEVSGCRAETSPVDETLTALPATWSTGTEYDDCPVSAYGR